jgi:hypothetical protein
MLRADVVVGFVGRRDETTSRDRELRATREPYRLMIAGRHAWIALHFHAYAWG